MTRDTGWTAYAEIIDLFEELENRIERIDRRKASAQQLHDMHYHWRVHLKGALDKVGAKELAAKHSRKSPLPVAAADNAVEAPGPKLKCGRCEINDEEEAHGCPYQEDVNDDHEFKCTCCSDCETRCAEDI